MPLAGCCEAAQKRLMDECGYDAAKAYVKALREHGDGKHTAAPEFAVSEIANKASKK